MAHISGGNPQFHPDKFAEGKRMEKDKYVWKRRKYSMCVREGERGERTECDNSFFKPIFGLKF